MGLKICVTCGQEKKPIGRDSGIITDYCDYECPGYLEDPKPGHLWPEEERTPDTEEE